jgi:hypothetical protein
MSQRSLLLSAVLILPLPLAAQEAPKPGPEHQKLAKAAGSWDTTVESPGQDGKPTRSTGSAELRMAMNGFWLIEDYSGEFMGGKFTGHGINGYDPDKQKYTLSWADTMGPSMMHLEGTFDAAGKVLTMTGTTAGMDGKPAKVRATTTWKDDNTRIWEMFMPGPDGREMSVLKVTYTRRAAKK